jgi:quinol monooxygenase YgiN
MIILMGFIYLNPSDVSEFLADVQAITSSTKAERGCLFYAVTLNDASAGRMLVAERWQDEESLAAHLQAQETKTFLEKWASRMKSDVLRYDASNERSLLD